MEGVLLTPLSLSASFYKERFPRFGATCSDDMTMCDQFNFVLTPYDMHFSSFSNGAPDDCQSQAYED